MVGSLRGGCPCDASGHVAAATLGWTEGKTVAILAASHVLVLRNQVTIYSEAPKAAYSSRAPGIEGKMSEFCNVPFDAETLAILEGVLDEAWASIPAQRNGNITRAALAKRILDLAVNGARSGAAI